MSIMFFLTACIKSCYCGTSTCQCRLITIWVCQRITATHPPDQNYSHHCCCLLPGCSRYSKYQFVTYTLFNITTLICTLTPNNSHSQPQLHITCMYACMYNRHLKLDTFLMSDVVDFYEFYSLCVYMVYVAVVYCIFTVKQTKQYLHCLDSCLQLL